METKHKKILQIIFSNEDDINLEWTEVKHFLQVIGATICDESGSRIKIKLNKFKAVFHKPIDKNMVTPKSRSSLRKLLTLNAGGKP